MYNTLTLMSKQLIQADEMNFVSQYSTYLLDEQSMMYTKWVQMGGPT